MAVDGSAQGSARRSTCAGRPRPLRGQARQRRRSEGAVRPACSLQTSRRSLAAEMLPAGGRAAAAAGLANPGRGRRRISIKGLPARLGREWCRVGTIALLPS